MRITMPDTKNQYLNSQHSPIAKTAKLLNITEEQLIHSLRSLDPEFMFTAVSNALLSFDAKMQNLAQDPNPASQEKSVNDTLELLSSISEFSPSVREEMGDLHQANAKEVLQDNEKLEKLQNVFAKLTATTATEQMHVDLTNAMSQLAHEVLEEQQNYTQRLKESIKNDQRRKEALDEFEHLTNKSISSKRDNALFDPVRVIGHLLAVLIHLEFIVPIEQGLYKHGFNFDGKQPDEFLDFNSKRFADTDVLPGAPISSPAASLPPGLKLGN